MSTRISASRNRTHRLLAFLQALRVRIVAIGRRPFSGWVGKPFRPTVVCAVLSNPGSPPCRHHNTNFDHIGRDVLGVKRAQNRLRDQSRIRRESKDRQRGSFDASINLVSILSPLDVTSDDVSAISAFRIQQVNEI